MHKKILVAGLEISAITKQQLIKELADRLNGVGKTFIITPYSEFLYAVLHKPELLPVLNRATYAIADGVGVLWADAFLSLPFRAKSFYGKVLEGLIQILWTLSTILIFPSYIKRRIPEKIVGADLIWDITALAASLGKRIYILGGYNDTPHIVAAELQKKYPRVIIVGTSSKGPDDRSVISDIEQAKPDVLFVAYGPIRQDTWIAEHLDNVPVRLAIGLGGTFDYIAGVKSTPPRFVRSSGLEWLYRLITQPARARRIKNATWGLVVSLLRYKVFTSQPYRQNAVVVIQNQDHKILVCRRLWQHGIIWNEKKRDGFENYWQFPQGGIDDGEDLVTAASREAWEETGLQDLHFVKVSDMGHQYTWRNGTRPLLGNRLKFKGQDQRVVYFRHDGPDDQVLLDNREFDDYQWISLEQLSSVLHPERQPLVDIVTKDLGGLVKE